MTHPVDVIREALLTPIPCPRCSSTKTCRCMPDRQGRLNWQAQHIFEALAAHDLLAPLTASAPTPTDFELTAQWLAEESRHPRYGGDGWRKLLESEADVNVAYHAALKAYGNPSSDQISTLGQVKDLLDRYVRERRAAEKRGV